MGLMSIRRRRRCGGVPGRDRAAGALFVEPLGVIANNLHFLVRQGLHRGEAQDCFAGTHELLYFFPDAVESPVIKAHEFLLDSTTQCADDTGREAAIL